MLRERSQTQRLQIVILFIGNLQNMQIHRVRKEISGCQGLGKEEITADGYEGFFPGQ